MPMEMHPRPVTMVRNYETGELSFEISSMKGRAVRHLVRGPPAVPEVSLTSPQVLSPEKAVEENTGWK